MSGLRLSFRLAWRAAGRERLATVLTALLVALPVVALVAAGTLARSSRISDQLRSERTLGQSHLSATTAPSQGQVPQVGSPLALLPTGSRVVADVERDSVSLLSAAGVQQGSVEPYELDYADPLARGIIIQREGRAPARQGEVAVTTYLAGRYHLRVGDELHLDTLGTQHIVGTVVDPNYLHAREIYGTDGAFTAQRAVFARYLIALPAGVDQGSVTLPQPYSLESTFAGGSGSRLPDRTTINTGALVIVLALLEASLTAGTAFAVGARRRRRDLALIAVNGGRPLDTAGVVLANGLVCGVIGVVVGLGAGLGAARLGYPHLQAHSSQLLPGLLIDSRILAGAAVFGIVSALLSAGFPALLAARGSLRNALGRARGSSGTPGWITVTGVGVFGLGVAVMAAAVHDASTGNGQQTTTALLGVVFVELGGVAVCPALLGVAGRFGARLPALPRLALRDAARQRARSGPAVAAIAAAVSGAMALSVYFASDHLAQVRNYYPPVPRNLVTVIVDGNQADAPLTAVTRLIGAAAVARSASSHALLSTDGSSFFAGDGSQAPANFGDNVGGNVVVGGPELLRLFGASPAAQQALTDGAAVLASGQQPKTVRFQEAAGANAVSLAVPTFTAGWSQNQGLPVAVISQATADRVLASVPEPAVVSGTPVGQESTLWAPLTATLSDSARSDLRASAQDVGLYLTIDSGPGDTDALESLALLAVAAIFSLIVAAAATVLAAAESRSELSILGAVGASGFARRCFTAAQGSTTALLGGVLGIAIGLVPGIAVVQASTNHLPLAVPWQPFAAFLVGLPLLAALGGVVFSRSRLPGVTRTL